MSQTKKTQAGPDRGSTAVGHEKAERDGESAAGNGRVVDTEAGAPGEEPVPVTTTGPPPMARRSSSTISTSPA